jgi:hypothetical protein
MLACITNYALNEVGVARGDLSRWRQRCTVKPGMQPVWCAALARRVRLLLILFGNLQQNKEK